MLDVDAMKLPALLMPSQGIHIFGSNAVGCYLVHQEASYAAKNSLVDHLLYLEEFILGPLLAQPAVPGE
jgi:hypothetical protein